MTHTATASFLNAHDEPAHPGASESLSAALQKYCSDSDLESLRGAYSRYISQEKELGKPAIDIQTIIQGLKSFNIVPSNSYERHIAVLKNKSDLEVTRSNWEVVGGYLAYALVKHALEEREQK